MMGDHHMQQCT